MKKLIFIITLIIGIVSCNKKDNTVNPITPKQCSEYTPNGFKDYTGKYVIYYNNSGITYTSTDTINILDNGTSTWAKAIVYKFAIYGKLNTTSNKDTYWYGETYVDRFDNTNCTYTTPYMAISATGDSGFNNKELSFESNGYIKYTYYIGANKTGPKYIILKKV